MIEFIASVFILFITLVVVVIQFTNFYQTETGEQMGLAKGNYGSGERFCIDAIAERMLA